MKRLVMLSGGLDSSVLPVQAQEAGRLRRSRGGLLGPGYASHPKGVEGSGKGGFAPWRCHLPEPRASL